MAGTLIISEKNKAAQAIADALGPVKTISVNKVVKVYSVPSKDIYVLPLRGHIQQFINTPAFKSWTANDPRKIITDSNAIAKTPVNYAGAYISALKKYAKICDHCIIGTDADVEGCTIGMRDAFPFVKSTNPSIDVKQLWLNDLQKSGIQRAYANLIPPKWSWAYSGEARAMIDAIIGFSATREVSLTLHPILKTIGVKFTSIGRVQTSLLYLMYLREHLIRNFKPDPFWTINSKIILSGQKIIGNHLKNNFTDKVLAETIYNKIKDEKECMIQDIQQTTKSIPPPSPLNTSKALLLITKNLRINAKLALKTLEDLYLNKIISYPRTDSDVYSSSYDHKGLLQKFLTHPKYGDFIIDRFKANKITPHQGKTNAGDHSPITPLMALNLTSSKFENDLQRKVYDIIARSYFATFGDPAIESDTKILFHIIDEPFISRISVLTKEGFYSVAPFLAKRYDAPLTSLPKIEHSTDSSSSKSLKPKLPVDSITLKEKETQPPPRYTDTSLLKLMEQKHLGTKSTRPAIIQILIDRGYAERKKRAFFVKELGFLLIDALVKIWKPFLDPKFTADVESQLDDIRLHGKNMQIVVGDVKKRFLDLFDKFRQQKALIIGKMNALQKTGNIIRGRNNAILSSSSSPGSSSTISRKKGTNTQPISTSMCPKCKKHPMKLVISRDKTKKFLVCSDPNCKTFLSLPKKGAPTLLKSKCSICGFNVVKITSRVNNKKFDYYLCPVCWNAGLQTRSGEGFCSKCKNFQIKNGRCVKRE
ncbi:MAG: DNA topoisomerase, partial [Promethearchaeota archaeon]